MNLPLNTPCHASLNKDKQADKQAGVHPCLAKSATDSCWLILHALHYFAQPAQARTPSQNSYCKAISQLLVSAQPLKCCLSLISMALLPLKSILSHRQSWHCRKWNRPRETTGSVCIAHPKFMGCGNNRRRPVTL